MLSPAEPPGSKGPSVLPSIAAILALGHLALRQEQAQPRLQAICARHGVPYIMERLDRRVARLLSIATGSATMPIGLTTRTVGAPSGETSHA